MTVEAPVENMDKEADGTDTEIVPEEENKNYKWYVVHSFSGYEQRVAKFLEGQLLRR